MTGSGHGRRYEPAFMRDLLEQATARRWSLVRLARESGVSLPTLARWRRRLGDGSARRFVEVVSVPAEPPARSPSPPESPCSVASLSVELSLPGATRITVRDERVSEELLVRVLRAVSRAAC